MADEHDRRQQVENLVSQDPHINDTNMGDFRMQLEQNLADWERRGSRMWRILCISAIAYMLEMAFALLYLNRIPAENQRYWFLPFMIVGWATFIAGIYSLIVYVGKYAPAIRKLRYDIQSAMIAELQQQVVALRDEIRNRPPGTDPRSS
jgi:hypothetical protein